MAYFLTSALGLNLCARISRTDDFPIDASLDAQHLSGPREEACWQTDVGIVRARGIYDAGHSQLLHAHVLLLYWWLPGGVYHQGWWHSYPRHPREWIKGRGRPLEHSDKQWDNLLPLSRLRHRK